MGTGETYCRIELLGNVGRDPLVRYADERTCTAVFSVATQSLRPDDPGGEETDWHDIYCAYSPALYAEAHVRKGDLVRIAGRLSYRKQRIGEERYVRKPVIIAEEVKVIARPGERRRAQAEYLETLSTDAEADLPF